MKILIDTTYTNVTEEWLQWWLGQHMAKVLPESVVDDIKEKGFAIMKSVSSSDGVVVETVYTLTY